MKKLIHAMLCMLMSVGILVSATATVAIAANEEATWPSFSVYSPEFPNAYIETEYVAAGSDIVAQVCSETGEARKLVGTVCATVYVEEVYDEEGNTISSRLLSNEEVANGAQICSDSGSPGDTLNSTRDQLTITFSAYEVNSANAVDYELIGTAEWGGGPIITQGSKRPSQGYDFIGFAWDGGHSKKNTEASGTDNSGNAVPMYIGSNLRSGVAWGFDEQVGLLGFVEDLYCTTQIYKRSTLNNEDSSAVFQYIHTWEDVEISLSDVTVVYGEDGLNASLSLDPDVVADQWELVCLVNEIES